MTVETVKCSVRYIMQCIRHYLVCTTDLATWLRLGFGILAAGSLAAKAQNPPGKEIASGTARDKGSYNLFKPTPREFMRGMSTDRPDQTESPYTVDAGR